MMEEPRYVPASGRHPGMTEITRSNRSFQIQSTTPEAKAMLSRYIDEKLAAEVVQSS
jgi:hypothetical protein